MGSAPGRSAARSRRGPGRCAWRTACWRSADLMARGSLHMAALERGAGAAAQATAVPGRAATAAAAEGGARCSRHRAGAAADARLCGCALMPGAAISALRYCIDMLGGASGHHGRAERQRSPIKVPRPAPRRPLRGCAAPRSLSALCPNRGDSCPFSVRSVAIAVRIVAQPGNGLSVLCPLLVLIVAVSVRILSRPKCACPLRGRSLSASCPDPKRVCPFRVRFLSGS